MKHEKSCGAVIFTREQNETKFLLIQHKGSGHWSFPKGHVEGNETEHETATREIKEETSLNVDFIGDFRVCVTYSPKANVTKDVIYFLAKAKSTIFSLQETEIKTAKWVLADRAINFVTYENDKNILKKAIEYLEKQ